MEKNIDSIIYIVISIVIIAISTLRKKKGVKPAENQDGEVFRKTSFFDLLAPYNNEATYQPEKVTLKEEVPQKQSITQEKNARPQTKNRTSNDYVDKPDEIKKGEIEDTNFDFDLKEAVIYSEILNRKTF